MVRPRSPSSLLRGEQEQGAQPMIRIAKAKSTAIATLGVDIGKNTFHLVGLDKRGAIVLRERLSRSQIEIRLANMAPCLVGMEACVGAHHLGRRVEALGHDVRLMAAKYVRPFCRKQKNDFNDAHAIAEAVTRPTVRCVALKTPAQLDLQALHRVRQRLISQRTGVINQIRALLLERGIAIRQGWHALRAELPRALTMTDRLTPRMLHIVEDLAGDWRRLDERLEAVSTEIAQLAHADQGAMRLCLASARSSPAPRWQASARVTCLTKAAILPPGSVSSRNRPRPADGRSWAAYPNVETAICANCLCKRLASCCSGRKPGNVTASSTGSMQQLSGCTTTSLP